MCQKMPTFLLNGEKRWIHLPHLIFPPAILFTALSKIPALCCPIQCFFVSILEGIVHHKKGEQIGTIQLFLISPKRVFLCKVLFKHASLTLYETFYMTSVFISHSPNVSQDITVI